MVVALIMYGSVWGISVVQVFWNFCSQWATLWKKACYAHFFFSSSLD